MFSRRTELRLRDMVEDSDRVATFLGELTLDEFLADELMIFAIERLLQRITEAVVQIDPGDMARLDGFPLAKMRAFGNLLRHQYREVDRAVVFTIARHEVPLVRTAALKALED